MEGSNNALVSGNTITHSLQTGIWFANGASSGVIEKNTIVHSGINGIYLSNGSNSNIAMNNQVLATGAQHCFAIQDSDLNTVVANTLSNCGVPGNSATVGDGILVLGGQSNRIERNTITNFSQDGLVLTQYPDGATTSDPNYRGSTGNYIAQNSITGYSTSNPNPTIAQASRTGIWLNDGSNGSFVYGNTETMANEGGISDFSASSNYFKGNLVSQNLQAGMLLWNYDSAKGFSQPDEIVIQNNYIFDNYSNGEILLRGINLVDIGFNYLSVDNNPQNSAGTNFTTAQGSNGATTGPSTNVQAYRNIIRNTQFPAVFTGDVTKTVFFQNRYFNPAGAYVQAVAGADFKWDGNVFLGGNFWSNFATSGNPSRGNPLTGYFMDPTTGAVTNYTDRYPYGNEDLGWSHAVTVMQPTASVVAAPGSTKTIAWRTYGCVLVDIGYTSSAGSGSIVSNFPDIGYYQWAVPTSLGAASNYVVTVTCKNSAGASLGASGSSPAFTVSSSGLILMTPGPDLMANAGSTLRVAWQSVASVGNVNVYLQTSDGGPLSLMSGNQAGDFVDITLPSGSTSRAKVVIQSASNSAIADSNDQYFTIRGTTPAWVSPATAATFLIGDVVDLEWISPQGSQFVDVELYDSDTGQFQTSYADNTRDYVLSIPDRGHHTHFVPDRWMTAAYCRLTFRAADGSVISQLNSGPIALRYTTATGALTPLYRMYLALTYEHLYTTDLNEYNVLGTEGWLRESDTLPPSQILNGNYVVQGLVASPYWRVYNAGVEQHLWTTDRNEYLILRDSGWSSDSLTGYVFLSQAPNSIPFYRLRHSVLPIHLWTLDQNELNVLSAPGGGWIYEGIAAWVYCSPNDTTHPGCATALPPQSGSLSGNIAAPVKLPPLLNENYAWLAAARNSSGTYTTVPYLIRVINAASMILQELPIAPGQIVSLTGHHLGPSSPVTQQVVPGQRMQLELANVSVLFDGTAAPVLFASDSEVHAIVPRNVAGKDTVTVEIDVNGIPANRYQAKIAAAAPGLFTADGTGMGQAAALNQDNSPNSAARPAARGSIVSLYLTGAGQTQPALDDDQVPMAGQLPKPVLPVSTQVGGVKGEVLYAGDAPGLPGVVQVNVRLPQESPVGAAVPIFVSVGDTSTQAGTTIAVQ